MQRFLNILLIGLAALTLNGCGGEGGGNEGGTSGGEAGEGGGGEGDVLHWDGMTNAGTDKSNAGCCTEKEGVDMLRKK